MGEDMHARRVHPAEERFPGLDLPLHKVDGGAGRLVVDRLHPFVRQRAGVLDSACRRCPNAPAPSGHPRRSPSSESRRAAIVLDKVRVVLRPVGALGLLLGVEVVEVAEELVEAVNGRQIFVPVAEMVLAEWPVA